MFARFVGGHRNVSYAVAATRALALNLAPSLHAPRRSSRSAMTRIGTAAIRRVILS